MATTSIAYADWLKEWVSVDIPEYDVNSRVIEHSTIKDDWKLKLINIAYQLWWFDFVYMLDQENWTRDRNRQSDIISKDWTREQSFGLCQLNIRISKTYKKFYNTEYFKNPEQQLLYCYNEYYYALKFGYIKTKFYWYNVRNKSIKRFAIQNIIVYILMYLLLINPLCKQNAFCKFLDCLIGFYNFSHFFIVKIWKHLCPLFTKLSPVWVHFPQVFCGNPQVFSDFFSSPTNYHRFYVIYKVVLCLVILYFFIGIYQPFFLVFRLYKQGFSLFPFASLQPQSIRE